MLQDLETHFNKAVCDVFGVMLRYEIKPTPPAPWENGDGQHLAGCVGFCGRVNGMIYLHAPQAFARRMASRLLGMAENAVDSDELIHDAIGEITNMIVGPIKSRLSDNGMPCVLTIPSVVRGTNFSIELVKSTERHLFKYRCPEGEVIAEVIIQSGQPA